MLIWTFYNVIVPAVLPVFFVYFGLWLSGRPKPLLDIIGDGQLCFFAIALLAVLTHDLQGLDSARRQTTWARQYLEGAFPTCLTGILSEIWVFSLITAQKTSRLQSARRRLTFASLFTTGASLMVIYFWRSKLDMFE